MYTHPRQIVSAVYGGTELLMFDVDKVITSIDFEVSNSVGSKEMDCLRYWYRKEITCG